MKYVPEQHFKAFNYSSTICPVYNSRRSDKKRTKVAANRNTDLVALVLCLELSTSLLQINLVSEKQLTTMNNFSKRISEYICLCVCVGGVRKLPMRKETLDLSIQGAVCKEIIGKINRSESSF